MTWFGITPLKKFPAPVLKPLAPFFVAGLVIAYGINSAQNAMMACMSFSARLQIPRASEQSIDVMSQPTSGRTTPVTLTPSPAVTKSLGLWAKSTISASDVLHDRRPKRSEARARQEYHCIIDLEHAASQEPCSANTTVPLYYSQ
ncbi:ATP synthase j chain-domain-containing protein [Xylaria acuta]|nr:ATP synthase j chain-domain-containing protein [Xylaria acuta]